MSRVSVVITTKDRVDYLSRAIESVLVQTIKPVDLIIVDDHSNNMIDDLYFDQYRGKGIEIKYIYNLESKGGNFSRNCGVNNSVGDVLMFLDDDDAWLPNKIQEQLPLFSNSNIGIVFTGKCFVNSNDLHKITRKSIEKRFFSLSWQACTIGSTSSVAVRRSIFEEVGGFDCDLGSLQDFELWIRVIQVADAVWDSKFNLLYTVHSSNNQVTANVERHKNSINHILGKHHEIISNLPFFTRADLKSRLYFALARSYRRNQDIMFLKYMFLSLFSLPSIRAIILPFKFQ